MRRWFTTLFALHFCVSVVLLTFSHLCADDVPRRAASADMLQLAVAAQAPELIELLAQIESADHGVSDGHADMPEFIHTATTVAIGQSMSVHHAFPLRERSPPTLAGLHKPPISTAHRLIV